jgi:hypothetical protein
VRNAKFIITCEGGGECVTLKILKLHPLVLMVNIVWKRCRKSGSEEGKLLEY